MDKEELALLERLQASDQCRSWKSLDDARVCVLCDRTFTGHDVAVEVIDGVLRLRCPTHRCGSGVNSWAYPGNPVLSAKANADWWRAFDASLTQTTAAVAA